MIRLADNESYTMINVIYSKKDFLSCEYLNGKRNDLKPEYFFRDELYLNNLNVLFIYYSVHESGDLSVSFRWKTL